MRISKNFCIEEFVPPVVFKRFGAKSIWFIDKQVVTVSQFFRDRYGKSITINDWHTGGRRTLSGFRPPNSTVGANLSQHRFYKAADLKWLQDDMDMDEIREDVRNNWNLFQVHGLTTIELGTDSWIHADCRWTNSDKLYEVPYWKK